MILSGDGQQSLVLQLRATSLEALARAEPIQKVACVLLLEIGAWLHVWTVSMASNAAGMLLNMADSQYSCLPTGQHSTTRGPGGNDFTIAGNIGLLIFILVALRFIAFGLLQGAYRFKKL